MATQVDIPSDLTGDDKAFIFKTLDALLNSRILLASLHGIYTGILAVTLWNIFINKRWPSRRTLVIIIILLYALITINFAAQLSFMCSGFIENGQNFWTVFTKINSWNQALNWETGIPATMSTILADSYIIWCCWMVWGQCWLIVLLPILCLITATVSKIIEIHDEYFNTARLGTVSLVLYSSSILTTTLWCTVFIIFRILTVTGVRHARAGGRLRVFHRFIAVLVESSALYSIALIINLVLFIRNDFGQDYADVIAGIVKGVAPTLLIGRAAAGHTRPTEEYDESATVSTLRFQTSSQSSQHSQPSEASFQGFTRQSAVLEMDIEAQREQSDELAVAVERTQ
ncbi:hypothetical protein ARMGADRAFT_1135155 [Armillaria gallica]|uniref:Family A G protein-coupled receptor-like protein n=1 Tax=Armillaria gallica TaxID=47427 RepID=A0A2H3DQS4_ARMGA|nr:hypothetical protein ARMGADRAFT_1135155 [Armillaria gallica]